MTDSATFQVHANVNADHGDSALRVTITQYDASGSEIGSQTFRRHVRTMTFDSLAWQAYSAVIDLAKMMAEAANTEPPADIVELDVPLF